MVNKEDLTPGYWWVIDLDHEGKQWVNDDPYYIVEVDTEYVLFCGSDISESISSFFKDGKAYRMKFLCKVEEYKEPIPDIP